MVMITLGTGVGGGIIIGGKILSGTHGAGGEIGHMTVNPDETETCGCGKKGCLEQYASATGVVRLAKRYLSAGDDGKGLPDAAQTTQSALCGISDLTCKDVFDAAKKGDAAAAAIIEEFGQILGKACSWIACVTDPDVFVIGGGVSKAGTIVTDIVRKYYTLYAFHSSAGAEFRLAALGNDAGIYGAAKLVL
jgi:glucokinase